MTATAGLHANTRRDGSGVIVSVAGEVDASNRRAWERLLSEMSASVTAPRPFVVDIRDLDFMACCGYAILAQQAQLCRDRGVSLCLVSNQPIVRRIVGVCGLGSILPIYPTVDSAVSQVRR